MNVIKSLIIVGSLFLTTFVFAAENNITTSTLSNGLKLIVLVDNKAPIVITQVWYRAGSADEIVGHTGIAHMLEHIMFTGTKNFPGQGFDDQIRAQGGADNAMTDTDYTMYYETLPAAQVGLALHLEADRMQNLEINEHSFKNEHESVKNELDTRVKSEPIQMLSRQLAGLEFAATPYDHTPIGSDNDVQQFTMQDARDWYDRWYAPNDATIVVAGDVNPLEVETLVKKYFEAIPPKKLPREKNFLLPPALGEKTMIVQSELAKVPQLILAFNVPNVKTLSEKDQPQAYALDVFRTILNEKLQKNFVRSDPPEATVAYAAYQTFQRFNADFSITSTPANKSGAPEVAPSVSQNKPVLVWLWHRLHAYFASDSKSDLLKSAVPLKALDINSLKVLANEELMLIDWFKINPVTDVELSRAKAQVQANYIYSKDSLEGRAMFLGQLSVVGLPLNFDEIYLKSVDAVTAEQVQSVVQQYFSRNNLTIGYLEPVTTVNKEGAQ